MGRYSVQKAIFLAAACSQAYDQYHDSQGQFVIPHSFSLVGSFFAKATLGNPEKFGFLLSSEQEAILVFRGTSTTDEWISDALAMQIPFPFVTNAGMTHRGFTNVYASARREIHALLQHIPLTFPITIVGHSLGAAVATLCALDLMENSSFFNLELYTFASPRAGSPDFCRAFCPRIRHSFRIHNRYDIIPRVPTTKLRPPRSEKTFYYDHVDQSMPIHFLNSSFSANHSLNSYYRALALKDRSFAEKLSELNPGFCPPIGKGYR